MVHVSLDLETLGTRPDAALLQVGMVAFETTAKGKIYDSRAFNRHTLLQDGAGSIDHGTLCFWLQEKSAGKMGKELSEKALPLSQVLHDIIRWPETHLGISWADIDGLWADPGDFDIPILKSAFARFGMDVPWDRRITQSNRSIYTLLGGKKPQIDWSDFVHHDATDDAIGQAMQLQLAFQQIGLWPDNTPLDPTKLPESPQYDEPPVAGYRVASMPC